MAGEEGLLGAAPADVQATALAEIETLRADPAFESVYQDRHHPGQGAAQAQLTALYEVAYPGDLDLAPETIEGASVDATPVEGETEDEAADRIELERVGSRLQADHGLAWETKVTAVREALRGAIGDEGFEAVVAAVGNDASVISELITLREMDRSGMLPELIRDYRSRGIYFDRAKLELENLLVDPGWLRARESRGRELDVANAREIALRLLADPPKKILRALEPLIK